MEKLKDFFELIKCLVVFLYWILRYHVCELGVRITGKESKFIQEMDKLFSDSGGA